MGRGDIIVTDFDTQFAKLSPEDQLKVMNDSIAFGTACIRVDGDKVSHADASSYSRASMAARDAKIAALQAELANGRT
jgi:hypothetical protein